MPVMPHIKPLLRSNLAKSSAKLLSANVIAQVIGFCFYPLLTRLYAPDDFGLLNVFLSIGGVLLLFATGAYYSAIVLPKSAQHAAACFQVGMCCNAVVTLLCLASLFFAPQIAQLLGIPSLAKWYYLLPVYVFLSATWQLLNYWYIRLAKFTIISTYQVEQSSVNALSKWSLGTAGFLQGGMLYAVVIAPLLSLLTVLMRSISAVKPLFKIDKALCKEVAVTYRKFPQFSLPKQLVNYIGGNLPVLLLTPFFDLSYIGYFGMALTLSFVPISIVTKSFYQVFYSAVTTKVHQGQSIWQSYRCFIALFALLVVLGFGALYWVVPSLTTWLLGSSWEATGLCIQWMLPWLAIITLTNTFDFVWDVFQKQDKQFYFELALLLLRVLALAWGIYRHDFWVTVGGFIAVSCWLRLVYAVCQYRLVHQYEKQRCKSN